MEKDPKCVDWKGIDEKTPLHYACGHSDSVKIIKYFINKGANVNAK